MLSLIPTTVLTVRRRRKSASSGGATGLRVVSLHAALNRRAAARERDYEIGA
jgi:hypothetical protein